MNFLSKESKLKIFRAIVSLGIFDNLFESQKIIEFLNSIWELHSLPSTDSRFKDLKGDIIQHIINNDDWDLDTLFIDKLSLLENDDIFQTFIEKVVDPTFYKTESELITIVDVINEHLNNENYELAVFSYTENGLPKYLVTPIAGAKLSVDFPINTMPFFVDKNPTGYTNKISSHKKPTQYPAFILVADQWDDFGVKSSFDLFYYENLDNPKHIGPVKIIHKTEYSYAEVDKSGYKTQNYIPDKFTILTDCCSLGQTKQYYDSIKNIFPKEYKSILWALQDAAMYSEIEDNFSQHRQFSSLIRENVAEQILRQEKYIIAGQNIQSRYQFSYKFTPKYTTDSVTFDFKFDKDEILPNRIYALIGENGVGKTQFITTLPLDIANKKSSLFSPHIPIFSKIIAISNSYYDNFTIPKSTASFNYVYCGLSKLVKGERETLSPLALKQRLHKSCKDIQKKERTISLKKILSKILHKDVIDNLFTSDEADKLVFQFGNIASICNRISSGQNTLMYILCDVVSNIRYDSLLLFDEPETHLHPNAITTLMTAINELLNEYQSYCIISTHSPLIIRELLSRSVYIMERNANYPSVKKIGLESFGENLTTLTEEIFGNKEVEKYYKNKIQELIDIGYTYEDIIELLESKDIPLNLNITIYIKNLIEAPNEKN